MSVHPNYPNGELPASQLRVVQSGLFQGRQYSIQLYIPVANAWAKLKAAMANRYGIVPLIAPDAGGYRDLALQEDMHVHPGAHNRNPNSTVPLAPVGQSNHGYGQCVDVIPDSAVAKMKASGQALAHEFGFYFPFPNDPNHMDRIDLTTATSGSTPLDNNNKQKEYDMTYSYISRTTGPGNKPQWALLGVQLPDGAIVTQDITVANGFAAFDPNGTTTDDAHWQPTLNQAKINSDLWKAAVAGHGGGTSTSADMTATNALLTELLAATKALNPPG